MGILQYEFMQRAFIVGIPLAAVMAAVGVVVVLKRLSMIGDALSHSSLAGVAAGLLAGIHPVVGALAAAVASALCIEAVRRKIPRYSEMAVAVVMSAGIGLAGVLSGRVRGAASFNSFLFGSIVSISGFELALALGVGALVLLAVLLLYKELFYICFDERLARLAGVRVPLVNFAFIILTALVVSIGARTVGALVVSSMMVVPVACAMQLGKSYRAVFLYSMLLAALFTAAGLFASFYFDLRPSGTIVLCGVAALIVIFAAKGLRKRRVRA